VELGGKTATGMAVPDDVVAALGAGRRAPVRITVGGHSYRTTIAVMGGRCLVPLSAENREGAGVAAGEQVDVDIELDSAPREVEVPDDLHDPLDQALAVCKNGKQQALKFNLKDIKKGKNLHQNIELKPGDTIVVP